MGYRNNNNRELYQITFIRIICIDTYNVNNILYHKYAYTDKYAIPYDNNPILV